jgi:hypothetical protein
MFKFWYRYKNQENLSEHQKGWFEMDMSESSVHAWEVDAKAEQMELQGWEVTKENPFN